MKRYRCLKYGITALTLAWMGVIFYLSSQPAVQSAGLSGGILTRLRELAGDIPVIGQVFVMSMTEHMLRKGAHMTEYAILGVLLLLSMRQYLRGTEKETEGYRILIAFVIGVLYAVSDEYHQTFVPGRSGEIKDVCIDSVGVVIGIALTALMISGRVVIFLKNRTYNLLSEDKK